jgi:seryl-tRNA synthetase
MLDLRVIRSERERVRAALDRRGDAALLDPVFGLDDERRRLQAAVDELRAERNAAAEEIGRLKRQAKGDPAAAAAADEAVLRMRALRETLSAREEELRAAEGSLRKALLQVPNLPHETAPLGAREEDAELVRSVGERPAFDFPVRDHLALAGGWIDMERGARTSGSRFAYLLGDVTRLWFAVAQFALARLSAEGFVPVIPPVMVREEAMEGTGFFPGDRASVYEVPEDELFLVGTSEVPIAALHADEILAEEDLPRRYCGYSPCFRREAGAAGRDTRGIFRTHQFDKVEMFSFCHPERSWEEHEWLLAIEERIAADLGLHYRVMNIAAGDLGGSAAKKYDLEVWLPGQERYRELTSCSNCTDYQARRLNCRYRPAGGGPPRPVHTLNGTAVTSSRTVIAVLETHQQADGSVSVPTVLQPFGAPAAITPREPLL